MFALAELVHGRMRYYQPHEFQTYMQGFCTLQMWRAISTEGEQPICDWQAPHFCVAKYGNILAKPVAHHPILCFVCRLVRMVANAGKTCRFEADSDDVFLHEEGLRLLFMMFRVEVRLRPM